MVVSNYAILKKTLKDKDAFIAQYNNHRGYIPLDIELRLNSRCNAKCVMCGVSNDKRIRESELLYPQITILLDKLKEIGCCNITLSGGEPTLHKNIVDIVKYAAQTCGFNVSLNTNGFLLRGLLLEQLISAGIKSFTFSLDSPVEKIHDSIRGLKGSYQNIVNAIDYINANSNGKVFIFINCVLLSKNIRLLGGFSEFYNKHRFHHINFSPASINTPWDIWTCLKEELRPSVEDVMYFKKTLYNLRKNIKDLYIEDPFGNAEDEIENNLHVIFKNLSPVCFTPMIHSVIQCNGDVIPCCYAPNKYTMGNIFKNSFEEIWNGDSYKQFRQQCQKLNFQMCASCRQYKLLNETLYEQLVRKEQK